MTRGRNTTRVSIRLPDTVIARLVERAQDKTLGEYIRLVLEKMVEKTDETH